MTDEHKLYLARQHRAGHTVVTAIGAITLQTVMRVRSMLLEALARHGPRLILDISGVDHLDPVGADALRRTGERAKLLGGQLQLVGPSPELTSQLRTHGLTWQLAIHNTLTGALATARERDGEATAPDWLDQLQPTIDDPTHDHPHRDVRFSRGV